MAEQKIVRATQPLWDAVKLSAEEHSKRQRLGTGLDPIRRTLPTDLVRVRNDTGDDRRGGEVMEVGDRIIDAAQLTNEYLWFEGLEPGPANPRFGILRRPTPDGKIGELQVSGVCKAWVDISDTDHERAEVVEGSHVLESSSSGPYIILWQPGSTGEQDCVVVRDGSEAAAGGAVYAVLDEDMCHTSKCAAVKCVVGTAEPVTHVCNPLKKAGQRGDVVKIGKVALVGAGYDADCPDPTPTGCADKDDNPICLPCNEGDIDPEDECDSYDEAQTGRWAVEAVEEKCVYVYAEFVNRDGWLVGGKIPIPAEFCLPPTPCGEIIAEFVEPETPGDPEEVDTTFPPIELDECEVDPSCCGLCRCGDGSLPSLWVEIISDCETLNGQVFVLPGGPSSTECTGSSLFWGSQAVEITDQLAFEVGVSCQDNVWRMHVTNDGATGKDPICAVTKSGGTTQPVDSAQCDPFELMSSGWSAVEYAPEPTICSCSGASIAFRITTTPPSP